MTTDRNIGLRRCRIDVESIMRRDPLELLNNNQIPAPMYDIYGRTLSVQGPSYGFGDNLPIPYSFGSNTAQEIMRREEMWRGYGTAPQTPIYSYDRVPMYGQGPGMVNQVQGQGGCCRM